MQEVKSFSSINNPNNEPKVKKRSNNVAERLLRSSVVVGISMVFIGLMAWVFSGRYWFIYLSGGVFTIIISVIMKHIRNKGSALDKGHETRE